MPRLFCRRLLHVLFVVLSSLASPSSPSSSRYLGPTDPAPLGVAAGWEEISIPWLESSIPSISPKRLSRVCPSGV